MSAIDDLDFGLRDDYEDESFPCRYCKAFVYWGEHYDAKGHCSRRLFTEKNSRLHDCRVKPSADAFDVVPE
jgi:hypothetical protein